VDQHKPGWLPWKRLLSEGALIVVSVFVAVALQSAWDDHTRAVEARIALGRILVELRQDRSDLSEVIAEQDRLDGLYDDLERWLADPAAAPLDSLHRGLDSLAYSNRTMYPRRSGWSTMVAGDQLGFLHAPDLVTRLGNLYENVNVRLSENGSGYDLHLYNFVHEQMPRVWDHRNRRFMTSDPMEIGVFRNGLSIVHHAWNEWCRAYMREYQETVDSLIADVEMYLDR